jgi:uncharacterized protein
MLSFPLIVAALSAGLLGGGHCVSMCGGVVNMLGSAGQSGKKNIPIVPQSDSGSKRSRWQNIALLHAGRLFTYSVMGGFVGSIGAMGLLFKPIIPIQAVMFVIGNLALIWLGLRLLGFSPDLPILRNVANRITARIHFSPRFSLAAQTRRRPFLVGMVWGCLPCGLVYGVFPFALLSGSAISGAVLMFLFGIGALPYLLLAQEAAQWLNRRAAPVFLKGIGASVLIGIGLLGLSHLNMVNMPSLLCVTTPS